MALIDIYNASKAPNVVTAKTIPGPADDYFENTYATGFTINEQQGGPTQFTTLAQQYYNYELTNIVIPASFVQLDQTIPLNEWNPDKGYYTPGAAGQEGSNLS